MQALRVDYRNHQVYANVATILGEEVLDKARMSQKYVVLVTDPETHVQKLEIYDESDFRTFFKWVDGAKEAEFTEVEKLEPMQDGEYVKWHPAGDLDLGAV